MKQFGLIVHEGRHDASASAVELAAWLRAEGHGVRVATGDAVPRELADARVEDDAFADGLDLAVSLGGDGSMLRAIELLGDGPVPVLGVNHGQLGYLTEVEPALARPAIERWLAGDFQIECRMMVSVHVEPAPSGPGEREAQLISAAMSDHGVNEVVLERAQGASTIRLGVSIDGAFFTSYAADGLIVATPTGSTAYAFSARGPIVDPLHRSLQLTPVSPHMLFDRTLVLAPESQIRLEVQGHRRTALSVDGRSIGLLGEGDAVICTASPRTARLVTFGPRSFHQVLKYKFGLNDR